MGSTLPGFKLGGIERGADAPVNPKILRREHRVSSFSTNAVLARQRAADRDAVLHNFQARRDHTLELRGIAFVKQNERMKVPIASVKNVADL